MQTEQPQGPPPASSLDIQNLKKVTLSGAVLREMKEARCAVCLEYFKIGTEVIELPCTHIFCPQCVTSWLELHRTCPVCRTEVVNVKTATSNPPPAPLSPASHCPSGTPVGSQAQRLRQQVQTTRLAIEPPPPQPTTTSIVRRLSVSTSDSEAENDADSDDGRILSSLETLNIPQTRSRAGDVYPWPTQPVLMPSRVRPSATLNAPQNVRRVVRSNLTRLSNGQIVNASGTRSVGPTIPTTTVTRVRGGPSQVHGLGHSSTQSQSHHTGNAVPRPGRPM